MELVSHIQYDQLIYRIYYDDTDAGGVIYYANYLRFLERGRVEFLRHFGYPVGATAETGFIFPVVDLQIKYKAPARLDDIICVSTKISEVRKASMVFDSTITNFDTDEVLIESMVRLACVNSSLKATAIPDGLYDALKDHLQAELRS